MTPADLFFSALQSLRSNTMRSVLTALGIIIGVGAVITIVLSTSKPGLISITLRKLRASSPAPVNNTKVIPTCATTSAPRRRPPLPVSPRAPDFKLGIKSRRELSPGNKLSTMAIRIPIAQAKPITRASTAMSLKRGSVPFSRTNNRRTARIANKTPSNAPGKVRTKFSIRTCLVSRNREAPRATRKVNSR